VTPDPQDIEGDFEVIHPDGNVDGETVPPRKTWTFLDDDLPNLVGIAAALIAAYFCRLLLFAHH
jgi:hypothetical protein